jgi:CO/xanthine dehydrogenase Mo-binding subunit
MTGDRAARLDGVGKVTGEALYVMDFALPGMLHGAVLRSPHPHALIRAIDTAPARGMPGVRAVLCAADIPAVRIGQAVRDNAVFATDRVRFAGQPVAAVAATTLAEARAALAAIRVDYETLPGVYDVEDALLEDAPLVHPEWAGYEAIPILLREGNRTARARLRVGDVEAGFAAAHRIFEHRFTTGYVHPGYTEPRVAIARWEGTVQATIWTSTQLPFDTQADLALLLQMPPSRLHVLTLTVGGGFGGKLRLGMEPFALLLARAARRPVKVVCSTEEELTAAYPRQGSVVTLRTGVDSQGRLLAKQGRILVDTGAAATSGPLVASSATMMLAGPYLTPNLLLEGVAAYTNKATAGSFRAPAGPMGNFAVESQMDIIADAMGIDPLELRLRNIVREDDLGASGSRLRGVGLEECLRRAAEAIGWQDRKPGPHRGKGLAIGWWMTTGGSSGVYAKLNPDGTVLLISGAVEIGTGALTGVAQLLAEALGLRLEEVSIGGGDTHGAPYDLGSQGSRTLFCVGNAALAAAADLRGQLFVLATKHLEAPVEAMALREGAVWAGNRSIAIAQLARQAQLSGGGLIGHGTYIAPAMPHDASRTENHQSPAWNAPSFHAHASEVSVDPATGEVTIERYVVAQDVGFAVNPTWIEGQIEGGVAQGIGQALSEEIVYRDGIVANANLTDYKMPTIRDVPNVETILVTHPATLGPRGAKGVGEPPCIEPPAALANAIAAATGLRMTNLPITAEKIAMAREAAA